MKASLCVFILGLVLLATPIAECSSILAVFPHMGASHWIFFRPFVTELVRRGHNVTLLSYFGIDDAELRTSPNYNEFLFKKDTILTNTFNLENHTPSFYKALLVSIRHLSAWGNSACDLLLNNPKTDEILERKDKFDLMITEFFHTDCAVGLAYKLNNIPVVGLSSCVLMPYYYPRFGMPNSPSFIPSQYVGFSEQMSLLERVVNFAVTKSMQLLFDFYQTGPDNEMLQKKFSEDFPDIRQLVKSTSLVLVNDHFSIGGARPTPPNVLMVAGVHLYSGQAKPLSEDLQRLLDSNKNGVILMSFGSIVRLSSLPAEKRNLIMKVFGQLPQTVIMKWENGSQVENKPSNVHFLDWLPQREILAHPNVKVFFSHGGMNGVLEALTNKVPVVGTPIYGDQYLNVAVVANRRAGVQLDYADWTEESLIRALKTCLSKEYQDNAALISHYLASRNPLDLGVTAIEQTIATKGLKWAQPFSVQMCWLSYHSIDAMIILTIPIILIIYAGWMLLLRKRREKSPRDSSSRRKFD